MLNTKRKTTQLRAMEIDDTAEISRTFLAPRRQVLVGPELSVQGLLFCQDEELLTATVCEHDGEIAGFVVFTSYETAGFIEVLCMTEQSSGISVDQLIDHVIDESDGKFVRICVYERELRMQLLLQKRGFLCTGTIEDGELIVMDYTGAKK